MKVVCGSCHGTGNRRPWLKCGGCGGRGTTNVSGRSTRYINRYALFLSRLRARPPKRVDMYPHLQPAAIRRAIRKGLR